MHLFSATGLAIIGIVLWVVVATVGRGRREWNILQRKRAIADCPSRSPFLVLIHSRHTPRKAAALLNMLYRQAQNPLRVRAYVLEEIDGLAPSRDVRHIYGVHHNTVDDHRSRIYVTTVARAREPISLSDAFGRLLQTAVPADTPVVWLSPGVSYLAPGWDVALESALALSPPGTLLTTVPLPPSSAPMTAQKLLSTEGFVPDAVLSLELPPRVRYPYLAPDGRLMCRTALRTLPRTATPPRTPFLHPAMVCGRAADLRKKKRKECQGALALTRYFEGTRFALLPFNLACARFRAPPARPSDTALVTPESQLGMWGAGDGAAKAERLLGILLRHGSERDYEHLLQKVRALSHRSKPAGIPPPRRPRATGARPAAPQR